MVVKFCDKNIPNDEGFSLELSLRMNYEQLAEKVAAHLHTDPSQLEFFKVSGADGPEHPIRWDYVHLYNAQKETQISSKSIIITFKLN